MTVAARGAAAHSQRSTAGRRQRWALSYCPPHDDSDSTVPVPAGPPRQACHTLCEDSSSQLVRSCPRARQSLYSSFLASRRKQSVFPWASAEPSDEILPVGALVPVRFHHPVNALAVEPAFLLPQLCASTPPITRVLLRARTIRGHPGGTSLTSILHLLQVSPRQAAIADSGAAIPTTASTGFGVSADSKIRTSAVNFATADCVCASVSACPRRGCHLPAQRFSAIRRGRWPAYRPQSRGQIGLSAVFACSEISFYANRNRSHSVPCAYARSKWYSSITTPTPRRPRSSKLRTTRPRQSICTSAPRPELPPAAEW